MGGILTFHRQATDTTKQRTRDKQLDGLWKQKTLLVWALSFQKHLSLDLQLHGLGVKFKLKIPENTTQCNEMTNQWGEETSIQVCN